MSMSNRQEMVTRDFISEVLSDSSLFNGDAAAMRKSATLCCLELLGYVVYDGKFVSKDKLKPAPYGSKQEVECQWEADTAACMEAANEANSSTGTNKTNNRKSAKGSSLRKAVLSKDV